MDAKYRIDPRWLAALPLILWMISPLAVLYAQGSSQTGLLFRDDFDGQLKQGWQWMDPKGDCTHSLDAHKGYLRIAIPGGSRYDLFNPVDNYSAPRLTREVDGDFIIETKLIRSGSPHAEGGLLVWKDYRHFIRFESGVHFRNELFFGAAVNGKFLRRAMDYVAGDPIWLRLERTGSIYRAFYSADGTDWHPTSRTYIATRGSRGGIDWDHLDLLKEDDFEFQPATGSVEMSVQGPLQVGISALTKGAETAVDYDYFQITGK
jgi:hypothetical protein